MTCDECWKPHIKNRRFWIPSGPFEGKWEKLCNEDLKTCERLYGNPYLYTKKEEEQ